MDEACNAGDLGVLDEMLPPPGRMADEDTLDTPTRLHVMQLLAAFREAVPDARWTIAEQFVQRHTIVTRLTVQGTFSGAPVGLAPGRPPRSTHQ